MIKVGWKTTTMYVDTTTGEIIDHKKWDFKIKYVITKRKKTVNYENKKIEWTNECEPTRQTRIEFE